MFLMCFFIFYPRKESRTTPSKSSRLFHIYIHTLKNKYLKSFITGTTDMSCRFSLSRKKGGSLQKTSRKLTFVVNHGYSNKSPDMHPFFLAQGPAFKEGFVSEPFENVNIYSLMCHILGIEPAPNNGSLQAVQHLLKEKEHKHDYTVLIVVSVISVLVLLLMSYVIVSLCVKNHRRIGSMGIYMT